jgi:hypothetical protein
VGSAAMAFTGMLVRHTCGQWPASCISISLGAWHGDLVSESVSTTIPYELDDNFLGPMN